jgi:lipid-binding SYLF domain-containing protein
MLCINSQKRRISDFMKTKIVSLLLLGWAGAVLAIGPAELDNRIRMLTDKFEAFQHQSDKCIPAETLRQAQGIILLDRTKAGFLFAYQGGAGVAMVKDPIKDMWSPVAFLDANEASLGFQIGGEHHFCIVLLMTTNAARRLADQKIDFGGEARGTAGNGSSGVQTTTPETQSVLVYDDRQGLYAGATIKGGAITADDDANRAYYGPYVSMGDILYDHKVQLSEAASMLASKIQACSKTVSAGSETSKR